MMRLEPFSKFKYSGYILDESDTDEGYCRRKVARGMRVADAIRFLVNARDLVCVRNRKRT